MAPRMKCVRAIVVVLVLPLWSIADEKFQGHLAEIKTDQNDGSNGPIEITPSVTGKVIIDEANLSVDLPDGFRFIEAESAMAAYPDFFGNPQDPASTILGIVAPSDIRKEQWVFVVEFYREGYISDEKSDLFSFNNVLSGLKAADAESQKARVRHKDDSLKLTGWAIEPFYDETRKILTWAEAFRAEDPTKSVVSYNARLLGRRGMLKMQAVAGEEHLDEIEAVIPKILNGVKFNAGEEYKDFNPTTDKKSDLVFAELMNDHLTWAKFRNKIETLSSLQRSTGSIGMGLKALIAASAFLIFIAYKKINSDD